MAHTALRKAMPEQVDPGGVGGSLFSRKNHIFEDFGGFGRTLKRSLGKKGKTY